MPRQPVEHYYSEKELHEMVDRINAFSSVYSPWKFTQARKAHQDSFGEVIKQGDHYFRYQRGPAFDDAVKLSALSIDGEALLRPVRIGSLFEADCGPDFETAAKANVQSDEQGVDFGNPKG